MPLWRKKRRNKRNNQKKEVFFNTNNRINLIMSIIFLLCLAVLGKLFDLQVMRNKSFMEIAANQHESFNKLDPSRGRIFFQDSQSQDMSGLYPAATNKDFAILYVNPHEIADKSKIPAYAAVLFENLNKKKMEAETRYSLEKSYQESLKKKLDALKDLPVSEKTVKEEEVIKLEEAKKSEREEIKNAQIALELDRNKQAMIDKYIKILDRPNSLYAEIEKRVSEATLKDIYAAVLDLDNKNIKSDDILIKNNDIFLNREGKETQLSIKVFGHKMQEYRFYPEANTSSHIIGFVGYGEDDRKGQNGIEGFFDQELRGKSGSVRAERDAKGQLIIINNREYQKAVDGSDFILTIDHTIQFNVCEKLSIAVQKHGADSGSVIVMEPKTGAILAMCSYPDFDPNNYRQVKDISIFNNPAIFDQYEPGSIYKAITMAAGLDAGKVRPDTTYNDTGNVNIAGYNIQNSDHKAHGVVNMSKVLEMSLNTGAIFVMRQLTPPVFSKYVKNFGFGDRTGVELQGESKGDIRSLSIKKNSDLYASTASFGQGISVTPIQMVAAFGAMANGGILMKPYIVKEIVKPDGERIVTQPTQVRRVISERSSLLIGGLLVNVVEFGHGKKAGVKGYYIGGKTGTAQVSRKDGRGYEANAHNGSFAGYGPIDDPAFVMIVRIDHPRDVEWAESSAAPLFGEIAEFILNYKQIPPTRKEEAGKK